MRKLARLLGLCLLSLCLQPAIPAPAAPMPPAIVANHATGECARFFGGDECMDCIPPQGWETLGIEGEVECPAGYTFLEEIESTCTAFEAPHCCTAGHSGAAGNCENLVMNERAKQCAFVARAGTCTLPRRWSARPEGVGAYDWQCPADYDWVSDVACEPAPSAEETLPAGSPMPTPGEAGRKGSLPCLGAVLVGPGALACCWVARRQPPRQKPGVAA